MNRIHEFYPMITATLRKLLNLTNDEDLKDVLSIILTYPNYTIPSEITLNPLVGILIDELDRQYARWNKGGNNGTR